jgi:subtilisin family serine protease
MQVWIFTFLYLYILLTAPSPKAWMAKIDTSVQAQIAADEQVDCIVLLEQQADLSAAATFQSKREKGSYVFTQLSSQQQHSQGPLQVYLRREGIPFEALFVVNALRLKGDKAVLRKVASRNEVARILPNPTMALSSPGKAAPLLQSRSQQVEWNLMDIGADQVWAMGYRGAGVVVGGQDTGIEWTHPSLIRQYRGNQGGTIQHDYNWYDTIHEFSPLHPEATNPCGLDLPSPCDDNVHGTHTMGTMVGEDAAGNQIGVAPDAQWIGVRNMERGYGNPFSYLEAFQWFLAPTDTRGENPKPDLAPHVINNSWYCPELEGCNKSNIGLLEMAVENLRAAGVVVVTSAGNFGSRCATITELPAVFPASFAVGATDINRRIATFSSRGPVYLADSSLMVKPDVSAPGVNVRSASLNGGYAAFSGTSMAGPHVAGTVALMISANPALAGQVDTIEAILRRTARPQFSDQDCGPLPGDQSPNAVFGYGIIDAKAAVEEALQFVVSNTSKASLGLELQVYPNPTTGWLQLRRNSTKEPLNLNLVSLQGQLLRQNRWEAGSTTFEWNLDLPAGLYFLNYQWRNKTYTKKLVVQ